MLKIREKNNQIELDLEQQRRHQLDERAKMYDEAALRFQYERDALLGGLHHHHHDNNDCGRPSAISSPPVPFFEERRDNGPQRIREKGVPLRQRKKGRSLYYSHACLSLSLSLFSRIRR